MNPQAIRIFYQFDDVGLTPQLELPAVTIGLIRQFSPMLEQSVGSFTKVDKTSS